jgi:hypothetical protein
VDDSYVGFLERLAEHNKNDCFKFYSTERGKRNTVLPVSLGEGARKGH